MAKADKEAAEEQKIKMNRIGGCSIPWEAFPQHA